MQKNSLNIIAFILLLSIILFNGNSFAQLSGTKTIPGDYATIEAAIADLNLQGVGTGGVTFNVAADHTETFSNPTVGTVTATGTAIDLIIFQKSGDGSNPLITAALNGLGTTDGIIKITGGDYIIFDGIDIQENSGNTDATTRMEWGYALVKRNATAPVDGCWNVTIKNSNITLNKANTSAAGIYSGNHLATSTSSLTLSDSLDAMTYCKFYSNTISNVYYGIRLRGWTNSSFYDQYNEVGVDGGNIISNYGGASSSAYGTNIEYQNNLKVANNTIDGNSTGQTGVLYGIRTGTGNNSNIDIYNNTVRNLIQGGTSLIYAITNSTGSLGSDNKVNIYNNTVENCLQPNSTGNSVWLIYNLARAYEVNIYENTIRNNTKAAGTGPMYCIYFSPTSNDNLFAQNIYDNLIYNNTSAGYIYGIRITKGTDTRIYNNMIYDLRTTSTSASTYYASGITVSSGPTGVSIYNNFISDLKATNSGYDNAIRAINILSTTSNSNIGVYYNTIFLNAASSGSNFGTSGIYHTYSSSATTASLDMRDNIIVNLSMPNGTGKTAAFRRSSATNLNNYSILSNNNCFYAGTPSANNVIFFDGTNFDQTLAEFKTRVAPRETNSVTENVPFVNSTTPPYDLHVQTTASTQTDGGGTPITTPLVITEDYDGDLRDATTPDIGADEFVGMGVDLTPPSIVYTVFDPTSSTSNRTLTNVAITDQSGVDVTPGTAPRVYYKKSTDNNTFVDNTSSTNGWKYTETNDVTSPFEFLVDYSKLFGGTGVQMGDVILYFVVAQDIASPANVGINSGDFNSTPVSVDLTAAAFPITGTINSYYIITTLSGTVTVGTGGDYLTLTGPNGLFSTFNGNIVSGNVNAQIISDITETGENSLNEWVESGAGNYTLTIQPNSAVVRTISGSYAGGLIRFEGADRVIVDGRFNGSGNYLTIQNTNTASNTATIRFLSLGTGLGCTDVTIRNCNIKAGANTSSNIFGIFIGSSTGSISTGNAGGVDYDNISILENNISKCREGIFARGTSGSIGPADQMQNLVISGNVVGSDIANEYVTQYGMYLGYADAPQVTYNEIFNMIYDVSKWGIYFTSNINNAVISKNKIHSIKQPGTTGYNSVGIVFWSSTGCFDNQIDNNMIYDLSTYGNTSMYLVGIRIAGGSGYKVYFNSISIDDTLGNPATNLVSSCLYFSTATTNADIRNNIFYNTRTGNSPKNYAVFTPNTTTFTSIDNNDYWTTGSVIGYFGGDITTFNDWKTATGQDGLSVNVDPLYSSPIDLHINSGLTSTVLESGGAFITGITTDIDEDVRPGPAGSVNGGAFAPDMGVDEFDGVPYSGPDTVHVSVMNNFFDPSDFTIQVGDFVTWTLVEGTHTTTSNIIPPGAASWDYTFSGIGDTFVYEVTQSGNYNYECLFHPGMDGTFTAEESTTFPLTVTVADGWNMVSVPGTNPAGMGVTDWWSGKDPGADVFKYNAGYLSVTTTAPTEGYWMKNVGPQVYSYPAINIVSHTNISAAAGWNMIGGYENTVPVGALFTIPPGQITGTIFEYSGGYNPATDIVPGYGYWVKLSNAAQIGGLGAPPLGKVSNPVAEYIQEDWGKIIITDNAGISYTLYAVNGEVDLTQYELPPSPPAGMFDIRFGSDRIAEDISSTQSIDMSGIQYPITVSVEGMDIRVQDESGNEIDENVKSGDQITISNTQINKLMVSGELIPDVYALEQNYPNPFNPSTVIEFSLPEDVAEVNLTIYDVLGQRVAQLVNTSLKAGKYTYQWDAGTVATGMYIYELRANKFVSVKKMILLK